jgi:hypothetical protein
MIRVSARRLQVVLVVMEVFGLAMTGLCVPHHQNEKAEAATPAFSKIEMVDSFSTEYKTDQTEEWMKSQFEQIAASSSY